jgi:uncharacterized membrane protein
VRNRTSPEWDRLKGDPVAVLIASQCHGIPLQEMLKTSNLLQSNRRVMKGKTAGFLFLAVCVILAVLLLTSAITPVVSGTVFAFVLAALGIMSRGFRRA